MLPSASSSTTTFKPEVAHGTVNNFKQLNKQINKMDIHQLHQTLLCKDYVVIFLLDPLTELTLLFKR